MKVSKMYAPTLREVPSEAEIPSHQLLLRAGFMRKSTNGMYTYLPLAWRVIKKIENIIREEMDHAGCQEIMMPIMQPAEIWKESGRWDAYGAEMVRLKDRHGHENTALVLPMRKWLLPWLRTMCVPIVSCR